MYNIDFLFNLSSKRRLSITEEKLEFNYGSYLCILESLDKKGVRESIEFKINISGIESIDIAQLFESKVKNWLVKFAYKTDTMILIPNNYFKINEDGITNITLKISADIDYYYSLNRDKDFFLESIVDYPKSHQLLFNMYNNALVGSVELKILNLTSILEQVASAFISNNEFENTEITRFLDYLISQTEICFIENKAKMKIIDKLTEDKKKSIRSKIQLLIHKMKITEEYCGVSAEKFVQECYSIRSNISHNGSISIPKKLSSHSINDIISNLKQLVRLVIEFYT
jgi:hypothetical protein